ncbi:capsular polysaccharide synthesis protein [Acinetobacter johnsonii]|uniref:Capsular polysaccharide synthesis protein n=1 Tax=Acinetobacter johnsonii TaxID=40214 RepID=A0AA42MVR8_ACIJO|nr:capsular polysaccharide synthesis protein [Acinetobacter johnsonii]MDH0970464.1 capsular polysaccharide synthesis protein [Acinetobacter johnsonii]
MKFLSIIDRLFYSLINKFRIFLLILLRASNVELKNEEPICNPKKIINKGRESILIPKNIWFYWGGELEKPNIVDICINKVCRLNPSFTVILLTDININQYVSDIEDFIEFFPKIQHKSDYIRLAILYKYGGIWLDASILTYQNLDIFIEDMFRNKTDFFAFYNDIRTRDFRYPIIENWFLISSKGNKFIESWLIEYKYALKIGNSKYVEEVKSKNPEVFHNIKKDQKYLFNYICAQVVLRDYQGSYIFWSCNETAFYYHLTGSWRYMLFGIKTFHYANIVKTLTIFKKPKKNPIMIKLVAGDRYQINILLEKNKYKKDTLLDEFLNL